MTILQCLVRLALCAWTVCAYGAGARVPFSSAPIGSPVTTSAPPAIASTAAAETGAAASVGDAWGATTFAIADPKFEAALVAAGIDDKVDGVMDTARAQTVKQIALMEADSGITSLAGIENFRNLEELVLIHQRGLASLDVSRLHALIRLSVWDSPITGLDLTGNTELTQLGLSWTAVESLNLSRNVKLAALYVGYNRLTALDVSRNAGLREAGFEEEGLTGLDFSGNRQLTHLAFGNSLQLEYLNLKGIAGGGVPAHLYLKGSLRLTRVLVTDVQAVHDEIARRRARDPKAVGIVYDGWTRFVQ